MEIANDPDRDVQCYLKQRQSLVLRDGILYRAFVNNDGTTKHFQLVVPKELRESFLETVHVVLLCHLRSQSKHEAQIARYAFWPCWKRDVKMFVAKCRKCAEYHSGNKLPRNGYLRPSGGSVGSPGQRLSADLIGPLPASNGFKYCLTISDMFTKFLHIERLRDKTAISVARAFLKFFLIHGWYAIIQTDWGGEFQNEISNEMYRMSGIQRHSSFSYMPRQNQIERAHKTVNAMVAKTVECHREWSEYMSYICFAFNSSVHKATNFSPNHLHFGRELATSLDILLANPKGNDEESYGEFAANMAERMQFAFGVAREVARQEAVSAKRYYDAKVKPKVFAVGDKVLVYCPRRRQQTFPKWSRPFGVEAVISKKLNEITYIVQFTRTRQFKIIHTDKLKLLQRYEGAVVAGDAAAN